MKVANVPRSHTHLKSKSNSQAFHFHGMDLKGFVNLEEVSPGKQQPSGASTQRVTRELKFYGVDTG